MTPQLRPEHPLDTMFDDPFVALIGPQLADPSLRARLPDFLVIGAPRSATTWLQASLQGNPHVFTPAVKELKFFSSRWREYDLGFYLSAFDGAGERQIRGELSPSYALLPLSRIQLLAEARPELKIVLMMREPVDRISSELRHTTDIATAAPSDLLVRALSHSALQLTNYASILSDWLIYFPAANILPVFYDEVCADPQACFDRIQGFLSLNADQRTPPAPERIHRSPEAALPPFIVEVLKRYFAGSGDALDQLCRKHWNIKLPPAWRRPPSDGEKRTLFDLKDQGMVAFVEAGFVYAAPRLSPNIERLAEEPVEPLVETGAIFAGRSFEEAQHKAFALFNLDQRLRIGALNGEPSPEQVTVLEKRFHNHVLCYWNRRFYAIPADLALSFAEIVSRPDLGDRVLSANTLEELRKLFLRPAAGLERAEQTMLTTTPPAHHP